MIRSVEHKLGTIPTECFWVSKKKYIARKYRDYIKRMGTKA